MSDKLLNNVWTDGCYDMVHYGHANQLRQAKDLGKRLIVGIHSDEEILLNKGRTIFNMEERKIVCQSIKWVDEVVCGCPYLTTVETLDKYNCDFCVHGDDITLSYDGKDTYYMVKKCNRYKECHRTISVSTTDLLNRMLGNPLVTTESENHKNGVNEYLDSLIESFKIGLTPPSASDNVVYVNGKFDILHPGIVEFLKNLKKNNTFVLVGVYSDECISTQLKYTTLLNTKERALSLLACRYVDWVIIDCPYAPSIDFIKDNFISKIHPADCDEDPKIRSAKYKDIMEANLLEPFDNYSLLSHSFILDRISVYHEDYKVKLSKKVNPNP